MTPVDLKKLNLPDHPGVYFFRGARREILYIGKATSLRDRVKSYFSKDLIFTRGQAVAQMVDRATTVTHIVTDSVLEAYILETNLIKKHQPPANVMQKDDKSFNYVVVTNEQFPRVLVIRGHDVPRLYPEKKRLYALGPFPEGGTLKAGMKIIRSIFPFRDTCIPGIGKPCFNRQLGLCPGVCTGEVSAVEYRRTIKNLVLFFEGRKSVVLKNLDRHMKAYALSRDFEKAQEIKKTIFNLEHIRDISLIKEEPTVRQAGSFRIESYDIAHMGGKEMTGVMVVVEDGKAKKSDYRKFKIRSVSQSDDTGALREVLSRRFTHDEWPLPDLVVVDGSLAQRNVAEQVLQSHRLSIPVVSVVKDEHHKPRAIEGVVEAASGWEKAVLLSNAEAHRFAIAYHKKLRRRKFLPTTRN